MQVRRPFDALEAIPRLVPRGNPCSRNVKRLRRVSGDDFELSTGDFRDPAIVPVGQLGVFHPAQVGGMEARAPKQAVVPGHTSRLERLPEGYLEAEATEFRFRLQVDEGEAVVPKR